VFVDVLVGVFVDVLVRVGVLLATVIEVLVAVAVRVVVAVEATVVAVLVAQAGREKVSFRPADKPPALHSNWVISEPVSFCTPTVALDPLWVTVP